MKPSSSSGQEIAHSTRPCSSGNFASPTKGSGVSVLRFSSVEARKSESPLGKWMLSFSGVWSPFSRRLLSQVQRISTPDRKSVVQGQSVSVRVDLGVGGILKK